jgi:hypothetical protein
LPRACRNSGQTDFINIEIEEAYLGKCSNSRKREKNKKKVLANEGKCLLFNYF